MQIPESDEQEGDWGKRRKCVREGSVRERGWGGKGCNTYSSVGVDQGLQVDREGLF